MELNKNIKKLNVQKTFTEWNIVQKGLLKINDGQWSCVNTHRIRSKGI